MGFWGKLFGSDEYNAKEPQGHLKTKHYRRLDWEIDENEYKKQDFIASSEYIIPSDQTLREILKELDDGTSLTVQDVFFRIDYMGKENEWYKKRDYIFSTLTLKKEIRCKENDTVPIYVLEGIGEFIRENRTFSDIETSVKDVCIRSEIGYENNALEVKNCTGYDETDNWYSFMLLFKLLEYYKYPTEKCCTTKAE
jgi:hypothetical protein